MYVSSLTTLLIIVLADVDVESPSETDSLEDHTIPPPLLIPYSYKRWQVLEDAGRLVDLLSMVILHLHHLFDQLQRLSMGNRVNQSLKRRLVQEIFDLVYPISDPLVRCRDILMD